MIEDRLLQYYARQLRPFKKTILSLASWLKQQLLRIRQDTYGWGRYVAGVFGYHIFTEFQWYPFNLLACFVGYFVGAYAKHKKANLIDYGGWVAAIWLGIANLQFTIPDLYDILLFIVLLHWIHTYVISKHVTMQNDEQEAEKE